MKKIFCFITFFTCCVYAQIIDINISDYSNNLPLDDVDVYFKQSTKNYISDSDGKVRVDLGNVEISDELIISKRNYQDAIIKVSGLKSVINVKLEEKSVINLDEAVITNLKAEDILKKVIENYNTNYNTEKYFFSSNFQQEATYDSMYYDMLDVDLQFYFKKDDFKIKSKSEANKIIDSKYEHKINTVLQNFIGSINIKKSLEKVIEKLSDNHYTKRKVMISNYSDKILYEIILEKQDVDVRILVDKETYAIVEFFSAGANYVSKDNIDVRYSSVLYKYRLHKGFWVLKESESYRNIKYKNYLGNSISANKIFKIKVNDYSTKSFPEFRKNINPKWDVRSNFNR